MRCHVGIHYSPPSREDALCSCSQAAVVSNAPSGARSSGSPLQQRASRPERSRPGPHGAGSALIRRCEGWWPETLQTDGLRPRRKQAHEGRPGRPLIAAHPSIGVAEGTASTTATLIWQHRGLLREDDAETALESPGVCCTSTFTPSFLGIPIGVEEQSPAGKPCVTATTAASLATSLATDEPCLLRLAGRANQALDSCPLPNTIGVEERRPARRECDPPPQHVSQRADEPCLLKLAGSKIFHRSWAAVHCLASAWKNEVPQGVTACLADEPC
ncbi:hypothetical protein BCR34DRAFT_319855 [Clohesyomyces aquaticus]|uniref:Uncharacterized protein n=1 Tax=Clohesyomyces aquaticus TaxID=1231657 RepID=A0A1Y2A7N2_9PLEO|nr:hypothetical protein BCR34DRAFT_319855 [Clohesyomyces aquaticus]